jgi:antitoxin component YwqK of YwqJK toxin-antitoxin module
VGEVWADWYASDQHGVLGERIDEEQRDEHEYVVQVERDNATETRTLFAGEATVERTVLEYADGQLVTRRTYRGEEIVSTEHFRYWRDGSLRRVRVVSERGGTVEYRYRDGRLREEWITREQSRELIRYDELGRVARRTRWENDELVERETREYWGPSPDDPVRTVVLVADGRETVRRYDESGRLQGTSTSRDGTVESDRNRRFENGKLVEEREESNGIVRLWQYEYEGDELAIERYLEDGNLVKVTEHGVGAHSRVETLYRDGDAVLRVYYQDRDRVEEQVIREGEVVRTRRFDAPEDTP